MPLTAYCCYCSIRPTPVGIWPSGPTPESIAKSKDIEPNAGWQIVVAKRNPNSGACVRHAGSQGADGIQVSYLAFRTSLPFYLIACERNAQDVGLDGDCDAPHGGTALSAG